MESQQKSSLMWVDLFTSEIDARSASHRVTQRGLIYLESGLALDEVLSALKVSRATWYRRVAALEAWRAENRQAAHRLAGERAVSEHGHADVPPTGLPAPARPMQPPAQLAMGADSGGNAVPLAGEDGAARG